MLEEVTQLVLNGLMAGAVLAVPAIGFTTIFAVLRFANFAVAGHMAVGAFGGWAANALLGLPPWVAVAAAFSSAAASGVATDHIALRPLLSVAASQLNAKERRRASYRGILRADCHATCKSSCNTPPLVMVCVPSPSPW